MKQIKLIAAAAIVAFSASTASAAVVTITSISGVWTNTLLDNGGTAAGEGTSSITWGVGSNPSGYTFNAEPAPFVAGNPFTLGEFQHLNFPVSQPWLDQADLQVTIAGDIDGTAFNLNPTFTFDHTETPNNANPCAEGGGNPCRDLVTLLNSQDLTQVVTVGGADFTLIIDGFENALGDPITSFYTQENQVNSAFLVARFEEPAPVPLPAGAVLMLTALGGLGAARRFRRKAA